MTGGGTSPSLLAAERLRNLVKPTGDIEIDAIANLKAMLARELARDVDFPVKAIEIYDVYPEKVPNFPSIYIEVTDSITQQTTISKEMATFRRNIFCKVVYCHADINNKSIEQDIRKYGGRVASVIQRNGDINGYCRMGVRQSGNPTFVDVIFGSQKVVRGFSIPLEIPVIYRDRSTSPDARP